MRDAELVEVDPETGVESGQGDTKDTTDTASIASSTKETPTKQKPAPAPAPAGGGGGSWFGGTSTPTTPTSKPLPNRKPARQSDAKKSISSVMTDKSETASIAGSVQSAASKKSTGSTRSRASAAEDDTYTPLERDRRFDWDRSLNDGVAEQLS